MQEVNSSVPVQADSLGKFLPSRSAEADSKLLRKIADLQEQLSSSHTCDKDLELQVHNLTVHGQYLQQLMRSAVTPRPIPIMTLVSTMLLNIVLSLMLRSASRSVSLLPSCKRHMHMSDCTAFANCCTSCVHQI